MNGGVEGALRSPASPFRFWSWVAALPAGVVDCFRGRPPCFSRHWDDLPAEPRAVRALSALTLQSRNSLIHSDCTSRGAARELREHNPLSSSGEKRFDTAARACLWAPSPFC